MQLFSIGVFYLLIFVIGVYAGRRRDGDQSSANLLLAGRGMPVLIGVCTMTATWVGGGYINGTAEAIFDPKQGIVWTQAPWGYALSMVLGGLFFARQMRRQRFTTLLGSVRATLRQERSGLVVFAGFGWRSFLERCHFGRSGDNVCNGVGF